MNTKDISKDGLEARKDYQALRIKKKLWLVKHNPDAPYTLF